MTWLLTLLTGGFLAGKRTYILGALAALSALASWAVGDMHMGQMLEAIAEALLGLGLMSLRAGVTTTTGRAVEAIAVADRVSAPLVTLGDFLPVVPTAEALQPVIVQALEDWAVEIEPADEQNVRWTVGASRRVAEAVAAHLDPKT